MKPEWITSQSEACMQRFVKISACTLACWAVSRSVLACPFCLLGMYEAHIANFSNYLMNALPILAPAVTALALYGKQLKRRLFG